MKPRNHVKERHAHADGATIQYKSRGEWKTIYGEPSWLDNREYRASLAEVEGRSVFEGDVLYVISTGEKFKVGAYKYNMPSDIFFFYEEGYDEHGYGVSQPIENVSWNPPKPKTITIELLREDAEIFASLDNFVIPCLLHLQESARKALK